MEAYKGVLAAWSQPGVPVPAANGRSVDPGRESLAALPPCVGFIRPIALAMLFQMPAAHPMCCGDCSLHAQEYRQTAGVALMWPN